MFDDATIDDVRTQLLTKGSSILTDPNGRRIFLINMQLLGQPDGVLLAYEGFASFVFTLDRPLNVFRLTGAGVPFDAAKMLADLLNRLTRVTMQPVANQATIALPAPKKGTRKSRKGNEGKD